MYNRLLKSIILPNSIEFIGEYAFSHCELLVNGYRIYVWFQKNICCSKKKYIIVV